MTGVPRLQHLPVPATSAGAPVVAAAEADERQRIRPVAPAAPAPRHRAERDAAWSGDAGRGRIDDGSRGDQKRALAPGPRVAGDKPIGFSRLASLPFMVQLLGQQAAMGRVLGAAASQTTLSGHRDAALLGSDIYRKAGGEPEMLPDSATFVRLAV
ncbi:MAG: hypothetical protein ACFCUW_12770 [Kiloniellaceae bacterium]